MATKKFVCKGAAPYNRGSFVMPEFKHKKISKGEIFECEEQHLDLFLAKYGDRFEEPGKQKAAAQPQNKALTNSKNKSEDLL